MSNELRVLVRSNEGKGYIIADNSGLSRAMVYRAIRPGQDIPDDVKMGTMRKITAELGYRVVVSFEPIEGIANDSN